MIKIFHGDDNYESYLKAGEEVERFLSDKKNREEGYELKVVNADDINSVDEFLSNFESMGFFTQNYLVFAKRLFKNKKLVEYLKTNLERLDQYSIIIWEDKKLDGRIDIVKKLKKEKKSFEFTEQKEWQIAQWFENLVKESSKTSKNDIKIKLSKAQINFIIENVGINKWMLINELEKIKIYLSSTKKDILTDEELKSILGFDVRGNMWDFLDFLGNRQKINLVEEYQKLQKYDSSVQLVIAMIARELSILTQLKFEGQESEIGVHPFVLKKATQKARNFSLKELKHYTRKLLDLDLSIKNGLIDEQLGMTLYLLSF
jgi:DNA polymerase-3 subunit delta